MKTTEDSIYNDFGKVLIPKNIYLFRRAIDERVYPNMFFGFDAYATYSTECKLNRIQVWKVKKDISAIFPIKTIKLNDWHKSSIGEMCDKYLNYSEKIDGFAAKKNDNPVRQTLLKFLNNSGITAWVCSLEDKYTMEVFLFGGIKDIEGKVEFVGLATEEPKLYEYNYFKYVKVIHCPAIDLRKNKTES